MAASGNETEATTMNIEEEFSVIRESVSVRHGQYFMLACVLFFQFINWLIKSQGPPKSLKEDEWKWRNLYVSWVHAVIASIWVLTCSFVYPELYSNLLQHITYLTFYCVCFSTGYFMYDFLDMIINNKILSMWELTIHHITVAGMFYYNIHIKSHIGFNIVALWSEINSVFLHWRKLLQMARTPYNSRKYIIVKYLNLISFVLFRGGSLVAISTACFFWRHKVSTFYYIGIVVTTFFLDVINIILFWRLFKSDVLRGKQGASTKLLGQDSGSQNNNHTTHVVTNNHNSSGAIKSRKRQH